MYSLKSNKLSLTCLVVGMGLSMSIYAAGPNPDVTPTTNAAPPTSSTMTTTTKTETVKKVHHHKTHAAKAKAEARMKDTTSTESAAVKSTRLKNGVLLNDVEPTGAQADAPTSTSDTMKGGVTTSMGK